MSEADWKGFLRLSLVFCPIRVSPVIKQAGAPVAAIGDKVVEIEQFVPRNQIDQTYLGTAHYLYPEGNQAADTLLALQIAMLRAGRAALGHLLVAGADPVLIEPYDGGLLMSMLYVDDVRYPSGFSQRAEDTIPRAMIEMAEEIMGRRIGDFDPRRLRRQDAP
jgi:DNA end-binding protein Ku